VRDDHNSYQLFKREEVIQWALKTKSSNVPIVGLPSLSVQRNKNSSSLKATLTSPNVVPHAAKQGSQSVMEIVVVATAIDPSDKCFLQYALSVAKTPRYRSSPARVDQYIVAIATIRPNRVDNAS